MRLPAVCRPRVLVAVVLGLCALAAPTNAATPEELCIKSCASTERKSTDEIVAACAAYRRQRPAPDVRCSWATGSVARSAFCSCVSSLAATPFPPPSTRGGGRAARAHIVAQRGQLRCTYEGETGVTLRSLTCVGVVPHAAEPLTVSMTHVGVNQRGCCTRMTSRKWHMHGTAVRHAPSMCWPGSDTA